MFNPKMARAIAEDRIMQAQKAHADILATCCPACLWSLGEANTLSGNIMQVKDVCEIIASYV